MTITRETIQQTAKLARLSLSAESLDLFTKKASAIIDYIHTLNELDCSSVEPTSHALTSATPLRDDVATPFSQPSNIVNESADSESNLYKVPKVI